MPRAIIRQRPAVNAGERKKKQHYVFQAYLEPWAVKRQIWCLRHGVIFASNLKGVACERSFYQSYPLTDEERGFVTRVMIEGTPEPLNEMLQTFLRIYCRGHEIKKNPRPTEWTTEQEDALEVLIENGAENWLAVVEDEFLPFLEQMREGKTAFYDSFKTAGVFILGLCVQFARTKQVRETCLRVMGPEVEGRSTLHMMSAVAHLMAIRISDSLFRDRGSLKVEIIENDSDTPFITTDQPVINLHGDANPESEAPKRLEFFYPLSPRRAMVLLEKNTSMSLRLGDISVSNYNVIMAARSHEQIFSDSKEYLESFAKIIGDVGSGNRLRSW